MHTHLNFVSCLEICLLEQSKVTNNLIRFKEYSPANLLVIVYPRSCMLPLVIPNQFKLTVALFHISDSIPSCPIVYPIIYSIHTEP